MNVVATVIALFASSRFEVAVNEPVQVMPSALVSVPKVPPSAVTSPAAKLLTASLITIVTVAVSPIFNALSLIDTELTEGAV